MTIWLVAFGSVALGATLGAVIARWRANAALRRVAPDIVPPDTPHTIDLLRRAYQGAAACLVVRGGEPIVVLDDEDPPVETLVERALELAAVARADGRVHIAREGSVFVAVGDGDVGACLVLGMHLEAREAAGAAAQDLRRWLSSVRLTRYRFGRAITNRISIPDWYSAGTTSLESIAFSLCEAVRRETGRATAVATRDPELGHTTIVAVSIGADRRQLGLRVKSESAVARACAGDLPVSGEGAVELVGYPRSERRRREERGIAFPMLDGRTSVGALIVFGPPNTLTHEMRERIMWYAVDAGPRVSSAWESRIAEGLGLRDALTRLGNRAALERAMAAWGRNEVGSLLVIELDGVQQIVQGHGAVAGNAAIRHLADVVRDALREDDVTARLEGARLAAWLPITPVLDAKLVAERTQSALRARVMRWAGSDIQLSCSIRVLGIPESAPGPLELLDLAEATSFSRGN